MVSKDEVKKVIFEVIEKENEILTKEKKIEKLLNFELYGGKGKLDSLDLVNFIVGIEQEIEDNFKITLSLTDDKAMSEKTSPFKTIETLIDYITKQLSK